ncbi:MAG TPA: hypothetical protein VFI02_17310 [Armatimonadota bacterium]|nr:hypothetical protein [Armatimonadota bacterium]
MRFTYSGGAFHEFEITFAEDEAYPVSGHFIATLWEPIDGLDLGGCLSLVLPAAFDPQQAETTTTFMGDRDPDTGDSLLTETSLDSLEFTGVASWANVTVSLVDFQALTSAVDTIHTEWIFHYRDGSEGLLQVQMTETAAESCRFTYDLGEESIYTVSAGHIGTGPGTFLPAMIRIHAPLDVLGEDARVNTFDRDWELKNLDFRGGACYYVVDDQEKAVVFLTAAYAQTHIQCKPLHGEWDPSLVINGKKIALLIPEEVGLIVLYDRVGDLITQHLDNVNVPDGDDRNPKPRWMKGVPAYIYQPKDGAELVPLSSTVETEIYWRYVGTSDTIIDFRSREGLVRDIAWRLNMIDGATTGLFSFAGMRFNRVFWDWKPFRNGFIPAVRDGKTAIEAVADAWVHPAEYAMYCLDGAKFVFFYAASRNDAMGSARFNAMVGNSPYEHVTEMRERSGVPNGYEKDTINVIWEASVQQRTAIAAAINNHSNNAKWIPGDWGYIRNTDPNADGTGIAGENVIYLGGSADGTTGLFTQDLAAFMAGAYFWGHRGDGPKIMRFQFFLDLVESWSATFPAIIWPIRDSMFEQEPNP